MSGLASFAHVRQLAKVSVKTAWDAASKKWSADLDCPAIDTEDTSEFFRVWLSCVMYGVCLMTFISVPYYLCSNRSDKTFDSGQDNTPKFADFDCGGGGGSKRPSQVGEICDLSQDPDSIPDIPAAKEHFRKTSPLVYDRQNPQGRWRTLLGTKVADMSEVGGIGIELYFRLLRSLGLCFAYCSIFSLPALIFSWGGNFVPDMGNTLAKTTIGNLGRMAAGGVPQTERLVIVGCQGMPLVKLTKYFGWCDFAGVAIFMLFVSWYRFNFIPKAAIKDDEQNITCKDFAIEIDCLPRKIADQASYQEKMKAHIEAVLAELRKRDKYLQSKSPAKVAEVALVRDYDERLSFIMQQTELKKQVSIKTAHGKPATTGCFKKKPIQDTIDKNDEFLARKLDPEDELPVLRAYVILNSPDDRERLLTGYRFAHFKLGRCCQTAWKCFEGKAMRVRVAPEPSNILWVNQDVPWSKRMCLKTIMFFVWLFVMVLSLVLIFMAQYAAREQGGKAVVQVVGEPACDSGTKNTGRGYICNAQVAISWTIAHAKANLTSTSQKDVLDCFCLTKGYSAILQSKELRDDVCVNWLIDAGKTTGLGLIASLIVVAVNIVLQSLIKSFAIFEKHTSVSSLNSSLMIKVAVSQFLNTATIIFALNHNSDIFPIFDGDYADFERGWYAVVGSALCLNMLLNAFTGGIVKVITQMTIMIQRWPCFTKKCKHQAELLALYENPQFDIAESYAKILVTCFCTLLYSPGLPILNFFAVIYFAFTFWVDKWILLQGSKRPPAFDIQMPKQATQLLLFAGPLHMFFSIAMYSHPCTFPTKGLGGSLGGMADNAKGMAASQGGVDAAGTSSMAERVSREATWMSFVAFLITLTFLSLLILKIIMGATFGSMLASMRTACCPKRGQVFPESPSSGSGATRRPVVGDTVTILDTDVTQQSCADQINQPARILEDKKDDAPYSISGCDVQLRECDVQLVEEITWDRVFNYIEKTRPPASYRMERNQEFLPLVRYMRQADLNASGSLPPLPSLPPLVPPGADDDVP